jgi:hypothetical protein
MPTYTRKRQAEEFRIHTIWDAAEAERLFGAQALARADRARELIKIEVAASAPAGEVVAR